MKAKKIVILMLCFCLMFGMGNFFPQPVFAETFVEEVSKDENISMTMSLGGRKNAVLQKQTQTATDFEGKTVQFLCFKWRELERLSFKFSKLSEKNITNCLFRVTHLSNETLEDGFFFGSGQVKTLRQDAVFSKFDFHYYVDSNQTDRNSSTSSSGNDYGLYKFDFAYSILEGEANKNVNLKEIYVAVLPDNIDEISLPISTSILYSITSASKLLNQFNFSLSTDALNFVVPDRLQWEAFGVGIDNLNYCLDLAMKQRNGFLYEGYTPAWPSDLENTTGTTFTFDSNNVEGIWTVMLTIKANDGTQKAQLKAEGISTIKVEKKSNLWLILLLCALGIFAIATVVVLVTILKKKRERVW